MGLSCTCYDDADWFYHTPKDYTTLNTKYRRRCVSCQRKINIGEIVGQFFCYRPPKTDYEESRFGDEVPMASKYMCEECTDLFFSFTELNFCITLGDDMHDLLKEYHSEYR